MKGNQFGLPVHDTSKLKTLAYYCVMTPLFDFFVQYVDAEGFSLFLKTYLEVDDFPADFCQRLFRYFQNVEQDGSTTTTQAKGK